MNAKAKGSLGSTKRKELQRKIREIDKQIDKLESERLNIGRRLDYDSYNDLGLDVSEIKKQDDEYISSVREYVKFYLDNEDRMFGYPSNMMDDSATVKYLRYLETKLKLANNCGDPYERGNYKLDTKKYECMVVDTIADNLGLRSGDYWGYITSGGTEGNFWGLMQAINLYPNAKVYYSSSTHYSVDKYINAVSHSKGVVVGCDKYGSIDKNLLLSDIKSDKNAKTNGVILLLNWGTTFYGAIDDVGYILDELERLDIPYYCHLDAANFGGIPTHFDFAPNIKKVISKVQSLSISLHKFLASPRVNGVLLSLYHNNANFIDYIGQRDSTFLGSRDFPALSTPMRVREIYTRWPWAIYAKNIKYLEKLLQDANIDFIRLENSNIFVITAPNDKICKKYQLSIINEGDKKLAHIIVMPHHKPSFIRQLVKDLGE